MDKTKKSKSSASPIKATTKNLTQEKAAKQNFDSKLSPQFMSTKSAYQENKKQEKLTVNSKESKQSNASSSNSISKKNQTSTSGKHDLPVETEKTYDFISHYSSKVCSLLENGDMDNLCKNLKTFKLNNAKQELNNLDLIKRRLNALKLLQMKSAYVESKFYEELYLLDCKYNKILKPLNEVRKIIVNGEREPNEEESNLMQMDFKGDVDQRKELDAKNELHKNSLSLLKYSNGHDLVKGIPEFWLEVFKNVYVVSELMEPHDMELLKYLYNLECEMNDEKPYGFHLKFYFLPNEYFDNEVLTKSYAFKIDIDASKPFLFDGPKSAVSKGCEIRWKANKNLTLKLNKRGDQEGQVSFFNFFDTSNLDGKDMSDLNDEEEAELGIDFEIGYIFKEKVIPKAILYYLGEINDDFGEETNSDYEDEIITKHVEL